MSFRKMMLIFAALAGAITFVPSSATARGRGGWGRGRGVGWGGAVVGGNEYVWPSGAPVRATVYGDGCWRRAVIETPDGPIMGRIWLCD